jgi:hypothetical protein
MARLWLSSQALRDRLSSFLLERSGLFGVARGLAAVPGRRVGGLTNVERCIASYRVTPDFPPRWGSVRGPGEWRAHIRRRDHVGPDAFLSRQKTRAEVIGALPTHLHATVTKVLPRGAATPHPAEIARENVAVFVAFVLRYLRPGSDGEFATVIYRRCAATRTLLARKLEQIGDRDGAARAQAIAAELGPLP